MKCPFDEKKECEHAKECAEWERWIEQQPIEG